MSDECTTVDADPQIRQGDIFVWHDRHNQPPWQNIGIAVTADCDLFEGKTHGRLSYIPALTMRDYLWTLWRPEKFRPLRGELETRLETRLNKCLVKIRGEDGTISRDAAVAWTRRASSVEIAKEIGLIDPGQIKDFCRIADEYIDVRNMLETEAPDLESLRRCYALKNKKATPTDHSELAREVHNSVLNLPGDVFYLSGLLEYEAFGLFGMLRHITQCNLSDIGLSPDELRFGSARARRVARLKAPYLFALTQNLGRVFTDIGLPASYEERRKNCSAAFFAATYGDKA